MQLQLMMKRQQLELLPAQIPAVYTAAMLWQAVSHSKQQPRRICLCDIPSQASAG
jgi:hypothetical protein